MAKLGALIGVIRSVGGLVVIKKINELVRKFASFTHHCQHMVEWGITPNPEWYDHFLDQYWGWSKTGSAMPWERGVFGGLALKQNGNTLELCCGDGFNATHFYAAKVNSIISVDFDENAIVHAQNNCNNPKITYKKCDIRTELPLGKFENIVWDAAIEHFTPDEINSIMTEIKNRLTPDGVLSGYTITKRPDGTKSHHEHEYEFSSKEDLMRFLTPHFQKVKVFETEHPDRHNLYFYASDSAPLPFDADWKYSVSSQSLC